MLIKEDNVSIDFSIVGYEFPKEKSDGEAYNYDANWLVCEIKYCDNAIEEVYRDTCLLTSELEEMADALEEVLTGKQGGYISDFMEPYLQVSFAGIGEKVTIIFHFVYDTLDGCWKKRKVATRVEKEEVTQMLNELRNLQMRYPER